MGMYIVIYLRHFIWTILYLALKSYVIAGLVQVLAS